VELIEDLTTLRRRVRAWRQAGNQIALVPTMGNLHRGHLRLVQEARAYAQRTVVSIFVNPMQFGPEADFAAYPRTLARDRQLLEAEGTDLLFAPSEATVYPRPLTEQTRVEVPGLSDILCGANRPGHFVGVATVVCKLFNMIQPDLAVFGEKDFQQLLVIRRMTEDLCLPVGILGVPTVREADGLALSSRNGYLLPEERARAPAVYRSLQGAAAGLRAGRAPAEVEQQAALELQAAGLRPDYVSVRCAADLAPPEPTDSDLVILAAARLGKARLIDNLRVSRPA
jgi:pantoate--beta-alanine ligase